MLSVTDVEEEVDDKHLRVVVSAFKVLEARHRLTGGSRRKFVRCTTLEEVQASAERIVVMLITIMT